MDHRNSVEPISAESAQSWRDFVNHLRKHLQLSESATLHPNLELAGLPYWDSIATLSVLVLADAEYSVMMNIDDFEGIKTLGDLHKWLTERATPSGEK